MKDFKFKVMGKTFVVIDWSNVHGWFQDINWEIDPKKLHDYLESYNNIIDVKLYFGVDKTTEKTINAYKEIESAGFKIISKEVKFIPVSLKDSPFRITYRNALKKLKEIKKNLETIDHYIKNLNGELEDLKEPQVGLDLIARKTTYVGIDFTPIEDALKILDFLREDFNTLQEALAELYKIITKGITRRKCDFDVEITRDIYKNLNEFDTLILFSGDGDFKAVIEDLIKSGKKVIVVFGAGHLGKEIQQINSGVYKCEVNLLREFLSK